MKMLFSYTITILSFLILATNARGMIFLEKVGHGYQVSVSKSTKSKTPNLYYEDLFKDPINFNKVNEDMQTKLFLKKTFNKFIKKTIKLHKKRPFLLSECKSTDCALSRNSNNSNDLRTNFENSLIENLTAPLLEASETNGIIILVFGSGGLLIESRIIRSFLEKGVRVKTIILIDKRYSKFKFEKQLSFEELVNKVATCKDPTTSKCLILELLRIKQFLDFITIDLKDSPTIIIYDSYQGLQKDKKSKIFEGGDLLIGIDFMEGSLSSASKAFLSYQEIFINLMKVLCYSANLNCYNDQVSSSLCKRVTLQNGAHELSVIDEYPKIADL